MKIRVQRHPLGPIIINVWAKEESAAFLGIRLGRNPRPLFSERYQGAHGIPVRWHYLLGRRISIRTGRRSA